MIRSILNEKELQDFTCHQFSDAGITVEVNNHLSTTQYIGVKVDDYYNKNFPMQAPKAVDFIVSVDCTCQAYVLYILELKNLKRAKALTVSEIHEKFTNTIDDFIKKKYPHIYLNDRIKYKQVFLYLVSDIYNEQGKSLHHIQSPNDSLKVETSLGAKLFRIHGKVCKIQYDIPPNPIISRII